MAQSGVAQWGKELDLLRARAKGSELERTWLFGDAGRASIGDATRLLAVAAPPPRGDATVVIDLSTLSLLAGYVIFGDAPGDLAGVSVSDAGDVNGDGRDDYIVGAENEEGVGHAYVIFGGGQLSFIDLGNPGATFTSGFEIKGEAANDDLGLSVSGAGDVNGDGFDDVIVGAPGADDETGAAYVIFGRANADFTVPIDLTALAPDEGFAIIGDEEYDFAGISVSTAGDIDGDGFDDVIIGAISADPFGDAGGMAYVIFGHAGDFALIELANLVASDGFAIEGAGPHDNLGRSVSAAGDINGDGRDDFVLGAPRAEEAGDERGAAYVIYGSQSSGFSVDLANLQPADGFRIVGGRADDNAGWSVSGAGDIDGDGIDDLIVGAFFNDHGGASDAGAAYVVYGKRGDRSTIDLANPALADKIRGDAAGDWAGFSVSGAGDVNGDGFDDVIVGARFNDDGGLEAGAAYLVYGKAGGIGGVDLTDLDAADGFIIQGDLAGDSAGFSVSAAGDVNNDGLDDILVGAPASDGAGASAGEAYVIYGQTPFAAVLRRGSAASQTIRGGFQADTLLGLGGDDTLIADKNRTLLIFGGGDSLDGGLGNDNLVGGLGADTLIGGAGADLLEGFGSIIDPEIDNDWAAYTGPAVRADLADASVNTGHAAGDVYVSIENLRGTAFADNLRGDASANRLDGGAGGDTLNGRAGSDWADYRSAAAGVLADLAAPTSNTGDAAGDSYLSIENLSGTRFADNLRGDGGDNALAGGAGGDALDGHGGIDRADYSDALAGVRVDLLTPAANTGEAAGDSYVDIENLRGGASDDKLYGDNLANRIEGAGGDDTLLGRGGKDTLDGGYGLDQLTGGKSGDRFALTELDSFDNSFNLKTIVDFTAGKDEIALDGEMFGLAAGSLPGSRFVIGSAAQDANDRLIYNPANGGLFFDSDGAGGRAQVLIATLNGAPALSAGDFIVI